MSVTLIGLGNEEGDISKRAESALKSASVVYASDKKCEAYKNLGGLTYRTVSNNADEAAKEVIEDKSGSVCYCVEGSVWEDEVCRKILSLSNAQVLDGPSKLMSALCRVKETDGKAQAASAKDMEDLRCAPVTAIYGISDEETSKAAAEKLKNLYGGEADCEIVRGDKVETVKIKDLGDLAGSVVIAREGDFLKKDRYDFHDLEKIIKILRAPGGCPWDRAQTTQSIKANVVGEAYELEDAIERDDWDGIEEECGDVLMQGAFHGVLSEQQGKFNTDDVLTRTVKKLIFRHSHIFGEDHASTESEALGVWDKRKKVEKNQSTIGDTVEAVPTNFPSCMYAQKVQKRSSKSGMDFLSSISAAEALMDEVNELIAAMRLEDQEAIFEESGDVMFSAVNVVRKAGADSEDALRQATKKFTKRFVLWEKMILEDGKKVEDLDDMERDNYWTKAKDALTKY